MATLTAEQFAMLRRRIGDDKTDTATPTGAYELSNAIIQAIYDDTTLGNSDLTRTTVWCLRERWGMAINRVAQTSAETGFTAQSQQKQEQIKKLLDYWEGMAGMAGGQSIGRSRTNTYRADSLQTEEPDYSNGVGSDGDDRTLTIHY